MISTLIECYTRTGQHACLALVEIAPAPDVYNVRTQRLPLDGAVLVRKEEFKQSIL